MNNIQSGHKLLQFEILLFPATTWAAHIEIKFTIYVNGRAEQAIAATPTSTTKKKNKYSYTLPWIVNCDFLRHTFELHQIYSEKGFESSIECLAVLFWPLLNAFKCSHSIESNDF